MFDGVCRSRSILASCEAMDAFVRAILRMGCSADIEAKIHFDIAAPLRIDAGSL